MGKGVKKLVVLSGVNFIEGGPLSVFKDALKSFLSHFEHQYSLILLVHSKSLFSEFDYSEIDFHEFPQVKNSWLRRLWFEYVSCYFISKRLKPFLWLALHDITPNVIAARKAVYCHNPAPFYKLTTKEVKMEPALFVFSLFYKLFYRINIKSNDFIIVQQQWVRNIFMRDFRVKNVIVAHPDIPFIDISRNTTTNNSTPFSFFYPAFPRVFKNYEVLLEATKILSQVRIDFEVIVTISGTENPYSKYIYQNYSNLDNVKFIGIQSRESVIRLYSECSCLVFPSKLETWGLPISEMKHFDKPMLVAEEMYARETVGSYSKVNYFKSDDAPGLSNLMNQMLNESIVFDQFTYEEPDPPFTRNWQELFNILLSKTS